MKKIIILFTSLLSIYACITPYEPVLEAGKEKVVVAGVLTNRAEKHRFQVSKSAAYNSLENAVGQLIGGASLWINDDKGTKTKLVDLETGTFETPATFRAEVGRAYQLTIILADGKTYQSSFEKMLPTTPIEQVSAKFQYDPNLELSQRGWFELFVDTQDPANQENYYYWNWRQYDRIKTCHTYSKQQGQAGLAFFERPCCESTCWEYKTCLGCINIASDALTNGKKISQQAIGTANYYSKKPLYYIVEQYALSKGAYSFWRTLKEQTQNVGGVFDATPSTIKGNIVNINDPTDTAIGYFQVSSVSEKLFFLDRGTQSVPPYPPGMSPRGYIEDVCMPCEEKAARTKIMPVLWSAKFE